MATLTEEQKMLVRHYCGYTNWGKEPNAGMGWRAWQSNAYLENKMNALTDVECLRVTDYYIPNCQAAEQNIFAVRELLLVSKAAVFTRNPLQLKENIQFFKWYRLELCRFLGIGAGPFLGGSSNTPMVA